MSVYRTQKAIGLAALNASGFPTGNFQILGSPDDPVVFANWPMSTPFARPCPMRPRHGFVDSRIVKGPRELSALWDETLKHDKDAEIILMGFIEAQYSAIFTTCAAAVGLGHDGATAGKAGCITLPLSHVDISSSLLHNARVTREPYVETVFSLGHGVRYVQVRDGEYIKALGNFIPERVTVREVLTVGADTDLIQWESAIANAAKGVVVHHPKGTMLSHFSVHASLHNIPVIFDDVAPCVGDVLQPTTEKTNVDCKALSKGIRHGLNMHIKPGNYSRLMSLIFFATHQAAALKQTAEGCMVIGMAAALFARFGAAACLGELRHSERKAMRRRVDRDQVYSEAFSDYETSRHTLKAAWRDFYFKSWSSSFGGKAWANCTANTIKLDRRIQDIVRRADNDAAIALIAQLNVNVNLAHNGGWWLNKFTTKCNMDAQAAGKLVCIADAVFFAYSCILEAALESPLADYEGVSIPKTPVVVSLIRAGVNNVYIKSGANGQFLNDKVALNSPEQCKALDALIQTIGGKSRGGLVKEYRSITMSLNAALQLAFPEIAERVAKLHGDALVVNNPFGE